MRHIRHRIGRRRRGEPQAAPAKGRAQGPPPERKGPPRSRIGEFAVVRCLPDALAGPPGAGAGHGAAGAERRAGRRFAGLPFLPGLVSSSAPVRHTGELFAYNCCTYCNNAHSDRGHGRHRLRLEPPSAPFLLRSVVPFWTWTREFAWLIVRSPRNAFPFLEDRTAGAIASCGNHRASTIALALGGSVPWCQLRLRQQPAKRAHIALHRLVAAAVAAVPAQLLVQDPRRVVHRRRPGVDKGVATSSQPAALAVRRSCATLRRPIGPTRALARSVSPNRMRVST